MTEKTEREEKIVELVERLVEYETEKKLIAETIKDLKEEAISSGVLTKDEMKVLVATMRLLKSEINVDKIVEFSDIIAEGDYEN